MNTNLSPAEEARRIEEERIKLLDCLAYWKERVEACLRSISSKREDIEKLIKRGYDIHDHELIHEQAVLNDTIRDYEIAVEAVQSTEEDLGLPITPYESIPHVDAREVPEGYKVKEWDHPHVHL